ncbi:BMC domain-containing protein [Clostridium frigidicarnis]|uniref:Carboxysome shell and ethanolamine utilization microcompartment protein CcmL/EutN n=1 Tax=Clostridium frigidicarnis TaxID=84698 RepID=A0A1I0XE12_9CLOT|nr:BMC domain-containing protein [Clostridium frigidicarnis]SFA99124.1 Carboxysome shell and ethanolamine utilization microcompartment protein CcmL/EutN [Clostridium frigidicarnis]
MQALGLIEVNGYLAAIEAADAALKAANVSLINIEIVKAGISTVEITGDVGSVKVAVDAGERASKTLGALRSVSVIPKLHEETLKIVPDMKVEKEKEVILEESKDIEVTKSLGKPKILEEVEDSKEKESLDYEKPLEENKIEEIKKIDETKSSEDQKGMEIKSDPKEYKKKKKSEKNYGSMKVEELRKLVENLNLSGITSNEIKVAKKDVLIKILLDNKKAGDK